MNWFFWSIDHSAFQQLLLSLKSDLTLCHHTKLQSMILSDYDQVQTHIRTDLKVSKCVFIALNAWFSSQRMTYLEVLMYWINDDFQHHEHLIEFVLLNVDHSSKNLLHELCKLLTFYNIKEKLFEVVTDNASNNDIMTEKLNLVMNRRDISWSRVQNALSCLTHIFNLVTQNFIKALNSEASDIVAEELLKKQIDDIEKSRELFIVIKKIMQMSNANE